MSLDCAALEKFEGEKPTGEHTGKVECEIVRLSDLDPKLRGRAVRMGRGKPGAGWAPKTLFAQGSLDARQYAAACELAGLHERGFVAAIAGVAWRDRVQGGACAPRQQSMLEAAGRYRLALAGLAGVQRELVVGVVVMGLSVREAGDAARGKASWLPASAQNRAVAAMALFAAALDAAADRLGL